MFAPANTAHFELLIPSVRNDFKVLAFDGVESISTLYAIRVELVSEYPDLDLESLLSQPAFLRFGHNGEGLHGRIEEVSVGASGKRLCSGLMKPETIGPMVYLLTEGVVAGVSGMFIEKQEQALVVLLSEVMAWKPSNAWRKDDVLLAAHNSGRFDGLA